MTTCPAEDAISERARGNEGDSSYHIRKRNTCQIEGIAEPEVSHADQVDRVPA